MTEKIADLQQQAAQARYIGGLEGLLRQLEAETERLQGELNKLHYRITITECNWDIGGYREPLKFWEASWRYIDELVPPEHQSLTWCNEYDRALGGE